MIARQVDDGTLLGKHAELIAEGKAKMDLKVRVDGDEAELKKLKEFAAARMCALVTAYHSFNAMLEPDVNRHKDHERQMKAIRCMEQKLAWMVRGLVSARWPHRRAAIQRGVAELPSCQGGSGGH